ncbi:MAG TPA: AraC family transcriptional regulator ligand-binding domain-containing protein [Aquabacterium sp.]|uniref:AraC family transcriptional regulator n=1 Tax=Aquabacterium sp. TaxID=1872578 RepID=UPI002E36ECFA|nr:AraC family transcriptional regulator ligand-binding domain-containing protein [Aquabacterium sp.]HEX5355069.1 AraC family transcriptional regulator ligand-binding domain-containing protein [Aquabacterium sp.]
MHVSPVNLKILAYTLEVEGFDSSKVLRHCGLGSNEALPEDGEWLPVDLFDRMMAAAIDVTGDPAFGLVAGKSLALMRYGVITPLVLSAPSLRQMLDDIRRFAVLSVERSEVELDESRQASRLSIRPVVSRGLSGPFRGDLVATSALQMLRFAGASQQDIHQVELSHQPLPEHEHRYLSTFGPRTHFGRQTSAISFNPVLLDQPMPSHDPVAYTAARTRADAALAAMHAGSDMADQVRQWLLSAFPRLPTVAETATHLGMNERSFRRQLSMLGASHAELTQECQRLVAERMLMEGRLSLKQIADELGFSSVHSFHRAFRRWSGLTPSAWRELRVATPVRAGAVQAAAL